MTSSVLMDVLHEASWDRMVAVHPRATVFHSRGWLEALERTYGYRAVALCSPSAGGDVANAFVFGVVSSRLTGNRLVSLPFSDHCDPLVSEPWELRHLLEALPAAGPGTRPSVPLYGVPTRDSGAGVRVRGDGRMGGLATIPLPRAGPDRGKLAGLRRIPQGLRPEEDPEGRTGGPGVPPGYRRGGG